jgi:hypothetical protein
MALTAVTDENNRPFESGNPYFGSDLKAGPLK